MRTLISFIALLSLVMFSLGARQAQESKPSPSPSPTESDKKQSANERIYTGKEVDVKAKIKPTPNDPPQPGRDCDDFDFRLLAVLKVVLHRSGTVSEVKLIKGSGCSFDKDAIRVARKIKFEPALKDDAQS